MIGSLSQLVRGAAILAIEDGTEKITRDLLDLVPVDYAAERADTDPRLTPRRSPRHRDGLRVMHCPRLPIPVPPARHETVASYVTRLATLHGLRLRRAVGTGQHPRSPGTHRRHRRRSTGSPRSPAAPHPQLARALPELRDPAPDWLAFRHAPATRLPPLHARHRGGRSCCDCCRTTATSAPATGYWIGPPDVATPPRPTRPPCPRSSQRSTAHLRLLHRHGPAATYDAVLTGS